MKNLIIMLFGIAFLIPTYGQNINLDNYEIYLGDTLISKSDFLKNGETIDVQKIKGLKFKPVFDGEKIAYNLNGTIYSKGNVKNKKETGFWQYWYPNGTKAREGEFIDGIPNGTHKYWFENGKLRSIGKWKLGSYDGTWEIYDEDGEEKVLKNYKDGKLIEN